MRKTVTLFLIIVLITSNGFIASAESLEGLKPAKREVSNSSGLRSDYTGWTKSISSGKRYYYENGIRLTGANLFPDGFVRTFDSKGVYLGKRAANGDYVVNFSDGFNIKLSHKKIAFTVAINNMDGFNRWDFTGDPHFLLYVHEDGEWKNIPYSDSVFDLFGISLNSEGVMHFSQKFSAFDYKFKSGLYRVKVKISNTEKDRNGAIIWKEIKGEFNIQ